MSDSETEGTHCIYRRRSEESSKWAGLSGSGSSFLRTWRTGHENCCKRWGCGRVHWCDQPDCTGASDSCWQVPDGKRNRGWCRLRWRGHPDSWYYGAYWACRNPLRWQYFRISGKNHQRESQRDYCRVHQTSCKSTSCSGYDQYPVHRSWGWCICNRG